MAVVSPTQSQPLQSAQAFSVTVGGAEANVAGHLASMGFDTSWVGRLGEDALGDRVLAEMHARYVDTRFVVRDPTAPTGVYFKNPFPDRGTSVLYYRAASAASRMSPSDYAAWPFDTATWVHLSGITPALSGSCDALVEKIVADATTHGYRVSFDVNYRARLWATEEAAQRCQSLGDRCHLVLVGLDEAAALWGVSTAEDVASVFPHTPIVVVKDSDREAVELLLGADGERTTTRVPARSVEVIEAIGAGDAFAAGYIGALLQGLPSADRLSRGHDLAAWTLRTMSDYRPMTTP